MGAIRTGRPVMTGVVVVGIAMAVIAASALPASAARRKLSPLVQGEAYRHGVVPTRKFLKHLCHRSRVRRAIVVCSPETRRVHAERQRAAAASNLSYGGGVDGVGVTTGSPHVYLVFWGSQWGAQGSDGHGHITLSGDPKGTAPYLQSFISGIGTGHETWSGVMTQYCEGVSKGAQNCPASSAHVGYPLGGALSGVWVDESAAAPAQATAHQLAQEAVNAATHFGNTTQGANRETQYVIVSPTGTKPDGFLTPSGKFCAWHDYTADPSLDGGGAVKSPDGTLAFTNLPYIPDAGRTCGQSFVNAGAAGALDGVSIVEGHEYAETITDQFPAGGWTDSSGAENGDKCAWISSGQGASQNVKFATGTFAMQSTWANDANNGAGGCEISHPVIGSGYHIPKPHAHRRR